MAVTEREREKVQAFFELAYAEKRLVPLQVEELDVLYHYSEWPAVLRVPTPNGIELWASMLEQKQDKTFLVIGAVKVGTQDEFGRNQWLPEVMRGR